MELRLPMRREKLDFHAKYVVSPSPMSEGLRPKSSICIVGMNLANKLRRLTAASVFESLSFLCAFPARCLLWFQPVIRSHSCQGVSFLAFALCLEVLGWFQLLLTK